MTASGPFADRSLGSVQGDRLGEGDSAGGGYEGAADAVGGCSEGQQLLSVRRRGSSVVELPRFEGGRV